MRFTHYLAVAMVVAAGATLDADRVRLRNGQVVTGMFLGADSKAVRLLMDNGAVAEIRLDQAVAVEFDARKPPAAAPAAKPAPKPAAAAPAAAAPAPVRTTVTVPSGTAINVRLTEAIDVDKSELGMTVKAAVDDPVMIGGSTVIPRGASAVLQATKVEQSGKMKGSDAITLKLNSIAFGGTSYDVTAGYVETKSAGEGKKTARKVGGGAGLGAIVGGIAGGGEGAAIGAAVGAVGGAIVSSGGEAHLKLPAETRLTFQLSAAVNVTR
jgi:hypothetical protein